MNVIAEGIPRGCQGLFTPVSLGYPISVFNKNSTLKQIFTPVSLGYPLSVFNQNSTLKQKNTGKSVPTLPRTIRMRSQRLGGSSSVMVMINTNKNRNYPFYPGRNKKVSV